MIGEDDSSLNGTPSRAGTPSQVSAAKDGVVTPAKDDGTAPQTEQKEGGEAEATATEGTPPATPAQLPDDVRQKLRKLERLEPKYSGRTSDSHHGLYFY